MKTRARPGLPAFLVTLAAIGLAGCAATRQASSVQPSGFLGDYSNLQPGGGDQALLLYIDRSTDWASFDSIVLDPVAVWGSEGVETTVSRDDRRRLASVLYGQLVGALRDDYRLVNVAGPRTLRLRVAITEASPSAVLLDAATTVFPQARAASTAAEVATGTSRFTGEASVEGELLDSTTERRLAAAVGRRYGTKHARGALDSWSDLDEAARFWATRLKARLAELRGGGAR